MTKQIIESIIAGVFLLFLGSIVTPIFGAGGLVILVLLPMAYVFDWIFNH